jgi:hypothetical protein
MKPNRPPVIATWMLRHFGCSPNNDAFIGDLAEEYFRKGAMWYWRQALKAIPVSAFREVRARKWMAARAVAAGFAIWTAFVVLIYPLFTLSFFGGNGVGVEIQPLHPIGSAWSVLWAPVLLPAGLKPSSPIAFLLWIRIALPLLMWTICGWIVARVDIKLDPQKSSGPKLAVHFHRELVLLFACSILLLNLLLIVPFISFVGPAAYGFLVPLAANAAASVAAILLGGSLHRAKGDTDE